MSGPIIFVDTSECVNLGGNDQRLDGSIITAAHAADMARLVSRFGTGAFVSSRHSGCAYVRYRLSDLDTYTPDFNGFVAGNDDLEFIHKYHLESMQERSLLRYYRFRDRLDDFGFDEDYEGPGSMAGFGNPTNYPQKHQISLDCDNVSLMSEAMSCDSDSETESEDGEIMDSAKSCYTLADCDIEHEKPNTVFDEVMASIAWATKYGYERFAVSNFPDPKLTQVKRDGWPAIDPAILKGISAGSKRSMAVADQLTPHWQVRLEKVVVDPPSFCERLKDDGREESSWMKRVNRLNAIPCPIQVKELQELEAFGGLSLGTPEEGHSTKRSNIIPNGRRVKSLPLGRGFQPAV